MNKLSTYVIPKWPLISVGVLTKFSGTIMDLLIPWILAHMIDDIVPLNNTTLVYLWGGAMIGCSGVSLVSNILANRIAARVSAEIIRKLRFDLFNKISFLSCRQIDDYSIPSLISRLTSDTYHVHHMIVRLQKMGIRAPILLIGGIAITLTLDPVLTLVLIAMLPLTTFLVLTISRKGIPLYKQLQKTVDVLVRTIRENITGVRVIKALSKTDYEKERFARVNNNVYQNEIKAGVIMAGTKPLMNIFLNVGLVLVIFIGAHRVDAGLTQPGKIIAFLTYFTIILNSMLAITRIFVAISKGNASYDRIKNVLDEPTDLITHEIDQIKSDYHISFEAVSFEYPNSRNGIENISFELCKGETLGIIGMTGSGKSTIAKLLMRFYDTDKGTIRINGRNVNSIPEDELHKKFGIVFQNDILFADTIYENIDFGRNISTDTIEKTAKYAQAGEFIESLPEHFEHSLTVKGSNLSGGQKQRVLISRALAGNPEILVLDDSSSALDYKTDAKLRKALSRRYENTTAIIIAQRISSIMYADKILVLDDGKAIGYGSHNELIKTCEEYAEISKSQMGGSENEQTG